jgi:hypothetical protein
MVATAVVLALVAATGGASSSAAAAASTLGPPSAGCPGWGRPAIAADPTTIPGRSARHALRVFAIQLRQDPAAIATAADYRPAAGPTSSCSTRMSG